MVSFHDITTDQLRQMLHLKERIEFLQGVLSSLRGGAARATATKKKVARKGKRSMSPETIEKMRAAQQARWAAKKKLTAKS